MKDLRQVTIYVMTWIKYIDSTAAMWRPTRVQTVKLLQEHIFYLFKFVPGLIYVKLNKNSK